MSFGRVLVESILQFFDADGNPLNGGSLTFYQAGTTTKQDVYSDSALTTALPNPVTLNSAGRPQTGAGTVTPIFLSSASYKVVLADSAGVTIWTADNQGGSPGLDAAGTAFTGTTGTFSGAVSVGGTLTGSALVDLSGASAGQIKFPATQNASSNANTLDDYDEGTWTPAFKGSTSQSGQVYGTQTGNYLKIGRLVTVWGKVTLSTLGTITGNVEIGELPFASAGTVNMSGMVANFSGMTSSFTFLTGVVLPDGSTRFRLQGLTAAATSISNLTQSNLSSTTSLEFTATYLASA